MQPTRDEGRVLLQEGDIGESDVPSSHQRHSSWIVISASFLGVAVLAAAHWPTSDIKSSHRVYSEVIEMAATKAHSSKHPSLDHGQLEVHATTKACSGLGENCSATRCCVGGGMQCYRKDSGWAECKGSCTPGPDPSADDGWPWDCEKLGSRSQGQVLSCSKIGEDCSKAQCCADPGLQCFEKVEGWAACKPACYPGMDLTDADSNPWSCNKLGPRARGMGQWVQKQCAGPGQGCLTKSCCSSPGEQCFEKDEYYGECAETCGAGWSCKTRGSRTPQPALNPWDVPQVIAPWVAEKCTKRGRNCSATSCCADGGYQCFEKNSTYAQCKGSCSPGPDLYDEDGKSWSCKVLGPQTPGWATEPWKERKEVSAWVMESCGDEFATDCRQSKCCKKVGNMCYEKNPDWGACSSGCVPGHRPGDTGGNWSCKELGPRTRKPWGKPSLFCFSVVQPPPNYEAGLISSQIGSGYGIFACDAFELFSTEKFGLGDGPDGPIETITFEPAPVVESKDGTAGNAELFMHVWDALKGVGKYQGTDWTVKVDPDAVLLPERLRWHLEPHAGETGYVINCAKPYMPEGPMMFGALEVFSRSALDIYFNDVGSCTGAMPWKSYGEDLFMGKCLELIGVARINDFKIYSDGVCRGVDCSDPDAAAFHPKKSPEAWHDCLQESFNPREATTDDDENQEQWFKDYMASYER